MKEHMARVHEEEKTSSVGKCPNCHIENLMPKHISKHFDAYNERGSSKKCSKCPFSSCLQLGLKLHQLKVHQNNLFNKCPKCDIYIDLDLMSMERIKKHVKASTSNEKPKMGSQCGFTSCTG